MLYGYKGKLLHIDLTKEESKTIPLPEAILKKYIGGRGLGAKLYWDLIPPGTDPTIAAEYAHRAFRTRRGYPCPRFGKTCHCHQISGFPGMVGHLFQRPHDSGNEICRL